MHNADVTSLDAGKEFWLHNLSPKKIGGTSWYEKPKSHARVEVCENMKCLKIIIDSPTKDVWNYSKHLKIAK